MATKRAAAKKGKKTIQEDINEAARKMLADRRAGKPAKGAKPAKRAATKPAKRAAESLGRRKVRRYVPKGAKVVVIPRPGETLVIRAHAGRGNCKHCAKDHDTSQHWSHAQGPEQPKNYVRRRSLLQRMKDAAATASKRAASRAASRKGAKRGGRR